MKNLVFVTLILVGGLCTKSFTKSDKTKTRVNESTAAQSSDCVRIYVKYSSGAKCTSGRVSGSVYFGGVTDRVLVNDSGYADICYSSDNRLTAVYYNGKEYEGSYYKGKSYTIYIS